MKSRYTLLGCVREQNGSIRSGLLLIFLLAAPNIALASDPTGLIFMLIGLPLLVASTIFFIITLFHPFPGLLINAFLFLVAGFIYFYQFSTPVSIILGYWWAGLPFLLSLLSIIITSIKLLIKKPDVSETESNE